MTWPTKVLTNEGWGKFTNPIDALKGKAPIKAWEKKQFDEISPYKNWKEWDNTFKPKTSFALAEGADADDREEWEKKNAEDIRTAEKKGINYWDVRKNPLFEAAAKARNIDWDSFKNAFGTREEYNAGIAAATQRWNDETTEHRGEYEEVPIHPWAPDGPKQTKEVKTAKPHRTQYGLDERMGGRASANNTPSKVIMENIYEMNKWINSTVKKWNEKYVAPIIERGPDRELYGLPKGTDVWEHYGLDRLPRMIPKELDINYEVDLDTAEKSAANYRTPTGYAKLDLGVGGTAGPGKTFETYIKDMEFAQQTGFLDTDEGNYGDEGFRQGLNFIFGKGAAATETADGSWLEGSVRIFGTKDYEQLQEQGLDDDSIWDIIQERFDEQPVIFGPAMREHFGKPLYDPKYWKQPSGSFGEKGLKLLQLQGMGNEEILDYIKEKGFDQIGSIVKSQLGIRTKPDGTIDFWYTDPHNDNKFGMDDYDQLFRQGLPIDRIKRIAKDIRNTGGSIGENAGIAMGLNPKEFGKTYDTGQVGKDAYDDMIDYGMSPDKMKKTFENDDNIKTITNYVAKDLYGYEDAGEKDSFGLMDIGKVKDPNKKDEDQVLWTKSGKRPSKLILSKIAGGTSHKIGKGAVDYIWGEGLYANHMNPPHDALDQSARVFGLNTIAYLENHPEIKTISMKTITAIARAAPYVGEEAAKQLGIPANMPEKKPTYSANQSPPSPGTISKTWDSASMDRGEKNAVGQDDLNNLRSKGYSTADMKTVVEHAAEHNGNLKIGEVAAKDLWGYKDGSHDDGKGYFGKKDYDFLSDAGASNAVMRAIVRGLNLKPGTEKNYIQHIK